MAYNPFGDQGYSQQNDPGVNVGDISPAMPYTPLSQLRASAPTDYSYQTPKFEMPKVPFEPVSDPGVPAKTGYDALSTAGKVAAFLPGIGAVVSGASALGSVIMNWWAAGKQMDANKKAQEQAQALYDQQMAESTRRYDIETGMKQKELKLQEKAYLTETALKTEAQTHGIKMDEEKLKISKEQVQWDKWLMLMTNVSNMMSSPQSRAGFAQFYKK